MRTTTIFTLVFLMVIPAFAGNKRRINSVKSPTPKAGVMGSNKKEIQLILNQYQNNEGAYIKKLTRLKSGKYIVELETNSGKCRAAKVDVNTAHKGSVFYYGRDYECE